MKGSKVLQKHIKEAIRTHEYKLNYQQITEFKKAGVDTKCIWKLVDIKHLHGGEIFGDIALTARKPRSASIYAVKDCTFATLTKDAFEKALAAAIIKREQKSLKMITSFPIFKNFSRIKL
jgi:CRP-like cAMP-binding protein